MRRKGRSWKLTALPRSSSTAAASRQTIDWANLKNVIDYEIGYQKTAHDAGDDCGCTLDLKLPGMPPVTPAGVIKKP